MQTYENERVIQQGEDWNLDIRLSQSIGEYIPYVISSEREHPHFVLTVASTKFEKNHRYVESWWQEIPADFPRFKQTTPFYIGKLSADPTSFDDLVAKADSLIKNDVSDDEAYERLYQYTLDGSNKFKYCYTADKKTITLGYELNLRFNILSYLPGYEGLKGGTANWNAQEYMYQITLVSGQLMLDTIIEAIDGYPDLNWRTDMPKRSNYPSTESGYAAYRIDMENFFNEIGKESRLADVYTFIKLHIPDFFQKDIDEYSKLGRIWSPIPILTPTKLRVDSNLKVLI